MDRWCKRFAVYCRVVYPGIIEMIIFKLYQEQDWRKNVL